MLDGTEEMIAVACDPRYTEEERSQVAASLLEAARWAPEEDVRESLAELARNIDMEDHGGASLLALLCGSMVEMGHDPSPMVGPITYRLGSLLESTEELVNACLARVPESEGEDADPAEAFDQARAELGPRMPLAGAAWNALDRFWAPAFTVFSADSAARARAGHLRALARKVGEHHDTAHWLAVLLSVLDDEPIAVIEPSTMLGILGRISGVVENFQLHVLLMDEFPRPDPAAEPRVSRRAADVARGVGPQQVDESVTGAWNLYTWKAIQPGYRLPDAKDYGSRIPGSGARGFPRTSPSSRAGESSCSAPRPTSGSGRPSGASSAFPHTWNATGRSPRTRSSAGWTGCSRPGGRNERAGAVIAFMDSEVERIGLEIQKLSQDARSVRFERVSGGRYMSTKRMQVVAALILCAMSPPTVRAAEDATERAIQLANQGKIEAAIDVLRGELKRDGKNRKARVVLGRIARFRRPARRGGRPLESRAQRGCRRRLRVADVDRRDPGSARRGWADDHAKAWDTRSVAVQG